MLHRALVVVWSCASIAGAVAAEHDPAASPCVARPVLERPAATEGPVVRKDSLVIGSLNMAAEPRIAADLEAWARERQFDVLFLQEVGGEKGDGADFVETLAARLGYHLVYAPANLMGDTEMQGLAILSRQPLTEVRVLPLEYHKLRFRSRCRIALGATVTTSGGAVHVTNVHLDTRINSKTRVAQLAPVLAALASWNGPQLIGGDFNTMDVYWWRTMWPFWHGDHQADVVRERLGESGFQTPFVGGRSTFKFMGLPIQLDWLYLKQLEATDWSVDDVPISDHRGIWARVKAAP